MSSLTGRRAGGVVKKAQGMKASKSIFSGFIRKRGFGVNPLFVTEINIFFYRRKRYRMFWKVKICIWKDFVLFLILFSQNRTFGAIWLCWYAYSTYLYLIVGMYSMVDMHIENYLKYLFIFRTKNIFLRFSWADTFL